MEKSIILFMWGYQPHFRLQVELLMNNVLKELGVEDAGAKCLLVGTRVPDSSRPHEVCVEPEDGEWPIDLFSGLLAAVEANIKEHPDRNTFYGDAPRMREKPERIRRDSIRKAVQTALEPYDNLHSLQSFAGPPAPVGGYHVVPVVQLPRSLFQRYRSLREPITDGRFTGSPGLIHAAVAQVLGEAWEELQRLDPGRFFGGRFDSREEIVRRAAAAFMRTPVVVIGDRDYDAPDLFERFNYIASLMYEGTEGTGRLLLANPGGEAIDVMLRLSQPVPFREHRWARKILQMASPETPLLADCKQILGLGDIAAGTDPWVDQNVFEVKFHGHYHWSLCCGAETLFVSKYGVPSLPQEKFPRARLTDTFRRLFPETSDNDRTNFAALFDAAVSQPHGSMIVVMRDANEETDRLSRQGTKIEPTKLTPDLFRRVSSIDGTIIIDPHCMCHAIGVILDGSAHPDCTPSRGSRYNSGVRYVNATNAPRMAIVVSDDDTVDVIPILRPRVSREVLEGLVKQLEISTRADHHSTIRRLDEYRFYLDQAQCDRVNTALERIHSEPLELGRIGILWDRFSQHPDLTEEYYNSKDNEEAP